MAADRLPDPAPEYTCTSCGFATAMCVCSDGPRDPETGLAISAAVSDPGIDGINESTLDPAEELYRWTFSCGHTTVGGNECSDECPVCDEPNLVRKVPVSAAVSPAEPPAIHFALDPDPFRAWADMLLEDSNPKVRALAETVVLLCDRYDELRAVFGVRAGQIVKWPGV